MNKTPIESATDLLIGRQNGLREYSERDGKIQGAQLKALIAEDIWFIQVVLETLNAKRS